MSADAEIAPSAFRFHYLPFTSMVEPEPSCHAITRIDESHEVNASRLYREAADGSIGGATANQPFTIIGMLSGGMHPFEYSYEVRTAAVRGREMSCDLIFTGKTEPGGGPSLPTRPYVTVDMPGLPAGEYKITFAVVEARWQHRDGTSERDDDQRDSLEKSPFFATFKIAE